MSIFRRKSERRIRDEILSFGDQEILVSSGEARVDDGSFRAVTRYFICGPVEGHPNVEWHRTFIIDNGTGEILRTYGDRITGTEIGMP